MRFLALPLAALSLAGFQYDIKALPAPVRSEVQARAWHPGCPVPLSDLRLLTVTYWGFDRRPHRGQLVVNKAAAGPLAKVFRQLYALRFQIRHMHLSNAYGPPKSRPKDNDISGSFECRQAVPSPCTGGTASGHWSMHAYGLAVDINPRENPYVGCGATYNETSRVYLDRSRLRPGMVTPAVVRAFASVGWGWGGSWSGDTKDYMHFSSTGH
jgi:D-alanyl-D-alanine carboxypeptidase-like protein